MIICFVLLSRVLSKKTEKKQLFLQFNTWLSNIDKILLIKKNVDIYVCSNSYSPCVHTQIHLWKPILFALECQSCWHLLVLQMCSVFLILSFQGYIQMVKRMKVRPLLHYTFWPKIDSLAKDIFSNALIEMKPLKSIM